MPARPPRVTRPAVLAHCAHPSVGQAPVTEQRVVLASGGGWAARPGQLGALPLGTLTIWLRVGAEEAVRRAASEPRRRPLLRGSDPVSAERALLAERNRYYALADVGVDTERSSVEDVTARVLEILAAKGVDTRAE